MSGNGNGKLGFGDFRLDTGTRTVWYKEEAVDLPLKAIDLLCLLVEKRGDVVTKAEIWKNVWNDAFVEETNLTHNVYLLRKTFRELGAGELIKTVPRRGYRFTGEVSPTNGNKIIYERATITDTFIEEVKVPEERRVRGFKNFSLVAGAVVLVALVSGFAVWWGRMGPVSAASEGIRSIAVLPFAQLDQSADPGREGVALADSLITRISILKSVRVASITAVSDLDAREPIAAGKLLEVDAVLVGTIYRTGEELRVSARILTVEDGKAIWSGEFERHETEDRRIHSDIAVRVTNALALHLDPAEKAALTKSYTENPDAFDLYQQARYEWNKRNTQGVTEASRLFRQAIALDPEFALAYAGLAEVVSTTNPEEAEAIAARALDLDPDLAEAHAAIGFIHTFVHRDWPEAEKALTRSIKLNPNYPRAHHWYAELLAILGRNAEAKAAMERALTIDPRSHNFTADLGQIYYFNGEYKEAEALCLRALELEPEFSFAHEYLSDIYLQTGEFEKAVASRLAAESISGRYSIDSDERLKQRGSSIDERRVRALQRGRSDFLRSLLSTSNDPVMAYYDARRYASLGERDLAMLALEKAVRSKAFHAAFVKVDPVFAELREEPRFVQVLRRMRLSE